MAGGFARIAGLHHTILDLAALALDVVEEGVEAVKVLITSPEQAFLRLAQGVIWFVNREVEQVSRLDKLLLPLLHRSSTPADDGILIDGFALVGDDQIDIDADGLAVALADGTGSDGVIEAEKMLRRLLELDAVGLEAGRELALHIVDNDAANVVAIAIGACYRIAHTQQRFIVIRCAQTIDDNSYFSGVGIDRDSRHKFLDGDGFVINP